MRERRGSFVPETIVPFGAIANLDERKAWLTSIIRKPLPETIGVNSMLMAADQLNKLDRLYAPELPSNTYNDNRTQILMAYSPEQLRALSVELRALLAGDATVVRELKERNDESI